MKILFCLFMLFTQVVHANECERVHRALGSAVSDFRAGFSCTRPDEGLFSPTYGERKFKTGDICVLYNSARNAVIVSGNGAVVDSANEDRVNPILTHYSYPFSFLGTLTRQPQKNLIGDIFSSRYTGTMKESTHVLPLSENAERTAFRFERGEVGAEDLESYYQSAKREKIIYDESGNWNAQRVTQWNIGSAGMVIKTESTVREKTSGVFYDILNAGMGTYEDKIYRSGLKITPSSDGHFKLRFSYNVYTAAAFDCTPVR